jgi:hypothetical protein
MVLCTRKEDVTLTEEMVHIATGILEQTNPSVVTRLISQIDKFANTPLMLTKEIKPPAA